MLKELLYLIEILHQTTTGMFIPVVSYCCILLKFYIKPQLVLLILMIRRRCILLKFYIKPQLSNVFSVHSLCCILLKFYIKPQLC